MDRYRTQHLPLFVCYVHYMGVPQKNPSYCWLLMRKPMLWGTDILGTNPMWMLYDSMDMDGRYMTLWIWILYDNNLYDMWILILLMDMWILISMIWPSFWIWMTGWMTWIWMPMDDYDGWFSTRVGDYGGLLQYMVIHGGY